MSDEEAIHQHLDMHPDDWTTRLILADLLEETGREKEAIYQRWVVKTKTIPCTATHPKLNASHTRYRGLWCYWKKSHGAPGEIGDWWEILRRQKTAPEQDGNNFWFHSRQQAEECLRISREGIS